MTKFKEVTRRIPLVEKVCPTCGTTFEGPKVRVYCSYPCARKAQWARNGAKYNANRKKQTKEQQG